MAIAILYREELREYDFGEGHPFRRDRYEIFPKFLKENLPEDDNYRMLKSEWATEEDLALICKKEYIDFVRAYYESAHFGYLIHLGLSGLSNKFLSGDNIPPGRPGKLEEAARLIIGQVKLACDLIQQGRFQKVVSLGGGMHHAKPSYGEGFCIYNDVAFGAKYLIEKYGLDDTHPPPRILILDTDAHAGNGTSEYFYSDPKVLFIDLHQDPRTLYPGIGFVEEIGEGKGKGFTVSCSLLPDTGWDSYQYIFEEVIFPLTEEFQPQMILRNGGTDPYWNDELTQLGLTIVDFRKIGENVREMAKICDGKEIDMIGSGYNKKAIGPGWLSLICGLADIKIPIDEPEPVPQRIQKDLCYQGTKDMVKELKRNLKNYWRCMAK